MNIRSLLDNVRKMILFSKKKPSQSQTIEEIIAIALNLAYFINKLNSANYNQNKPPYLCIHIYLNIAHEVYNIQLKDMMNEDNRVYRVYADGVFDCFHLGHANMLKQAKQCLPGKKVHLIAGINKQSDVEKFKGSCINSEKERVELVRSCKWVDEVFEDAPWIINQKFLTDNNIDYVAHDDVPYVTADTEDAYGECKRLGKFIATQRTQGISTSDLVTRIIADRDKYIGRNLKRGVSRQDLNLSLVEYWIFVLKQKFCPRRAVAAKPKKE